LSPIVNGNGTDRAEHTQTSTMASHCLGHVPTPQHIVDVHWPCCAAVGNVLNDNAIIADCTG